MVVSAIDLKVHPASIDISTYLNKGSVVPGNEDNTSTAEYQQPIIFLTPVPSVFYYFVL